LSVLFPIFRRFDPLNGHDCRNFGTNLPDMLPLEGVDVHINGILSVAVQKLTRYLPEYTKVAE
jgi:hypothetical protein